MLGRKFEVRDELVAPVHQRRRRLGVLRLVGLDEFVDGPVARVESAGVHSAECYGSTRGVTEALLGPRARPVGEVTLRLFNSAFLLGVLFCSACGGRATQAEHVSASGGSGTGPSPVGTGASGATGGADASDASSAESCGGTVCNGVCTDLTADPGHCGGCTTACAPGQVCASGACVATCPPDLTACGSGCVDVSADALQCGHCGNGCAPGLACQDGVCGCPGSHGAKCGGACVNLANDPNNCGLCGNVCLPSGPSSVKVPEGYTGQGLVEKLIDGGHSGFSNCLPPGPPTIPASPTAALMPIPFVCADGICVLSADTGSPGSRSPVAPGGLCCPHGFSFCGSLCADLTADDLNCGACGVVCRGGAHCNAGSCVCPAGLGYCDGACIDLQASVANCGACGATCPVGVPCFAGSCVMSCPAGQTQCGTSCVDLSSTKDHCGFCDQVCSGTLICAQGQCGCPSGLSNCAGYCVDLTSDPDKCGNCGMTCSEGGTCSGGACL
jgi:hypothetical protein